MHGTYIKIKNGTKLKYMHRSIYVTIRPHREHRLVLIKI